MQTVADKLNDNYYNFLNISHVIDISHVVSTNLSKYYYNNLVTEIIRENILVLKLDQ